MDDVRARHREHGHDRPASPSFIGALTGVRAVMGLWIVADHLYGPAARLLPTLGVLRPVLQGGIALDTFFILSGFVIAHVWAGRLATLDRREYGAFLWARLARLYPTHLFALLVTAVLLGLGAGVELPASLGWDYSVWTFAGNLLALQAVPGVDAWNVPSWSVSTEFGAYLVFPLLAVALVRPLRRRLPVLVGVAVVVSVLVADLVPAAPLVTVMWLRPLSEIALGCLLWRVWARRPRAHRGWDATALAAFAGVVVVMFLVPDGPRRPLAVLLLGVVVVAVAGSTGIVRRALTTRPMDWAGRTSYSRYLMHVPVLTVLWAFLPGDRFVGAPLALRIALVTSWVVAPFAVGALTFRLVEEPARRGVRRLGARWGVEDGRAPRSVPGPGGPAQAPDVARASAQ